MSTTPETASTSTAPRASTHVEDYDIVILGGGTGSTVAAWTFASEGRESRCSTASTSGARAPTSPACPAKISFTRRAWLPTFATAKTTASRPTASVWTCLPYASANAKWFPG